MSAPSSNESRSAAASKIISGIAHMSTLPEVTLRIMDVIDDPTSSARDLHRIVASDPALSSRILKVVNSSFYGMPRQIGSMNRAISLLGLNAVKNIAVAASLGRIFRGRSAMPNFDAKALWSHSLNTAVAACLIARESGSSRSDEAFLAGLLHDIGLMVEWQHDQSKFHSLMIEIDTDESGAPGTCLIGAEESCFGVNHQDLGAALCEQWKFPRSLVTSTAHHHDPGPLIGDDSLIPWFVHQADRLSARHFGGFRLDLPDLEISGDACDVTGVGPLALERIVDSMSASGDEIQFSIAA
ncbi:MAG: HDOD domain-containing protein [Planctomycetota bacterium]|nr:HDOD domain-containing protein [Planctomycetota bacterium]